MKISRKTTVEELAAIVVEKLKEKKISAVLVGGAVVSLYTNNKYQSHDLDFISSADHARIVEAMQELGFDTSKKDFTTPEMVRCVHSIDTGVIEPKALSISNKLGCIRKYSIFSTV